MAAELTAVAESPHRTLVLEVPDWAAVALAVEHGISHADELLVLQSGRICASTPSARRRGVHAGMRKRAAQTIAPRAHVFQRSLDTEHRVFAAGISVLEDAVAQFCLLQPGQVAVPLRALTRVADSEAVVVEKLLVELTDRTGWEVYAGIADTHFAALLAAADSTRVEPGQTAAFLAPHPVDVLQRAQVQTDLISVFHSLGIDRLGQLAELPRADIYARLGQPGLRAWTLAAGLPESLPSSHIRQREHTAFARIDPPTGRLDELSFRARSLALTFLQQVRASGLVCSQVTVTLGAANGQASIRTWRLDDVTESALADRVRWQADGWLAQGGRAAQEATGAGEGLSSIEFAAAELVDPLDEQHSLFHRQAGSVGKTLERLQGLFGPETVVVPSLQGGRDPGETNVWTPWQQQPAVLRSTDAPWPGALPAPRPTLVENTPVELLDGRGETVIARPRGLDNVPALLRFPSGQEHRVCDYSSSWPVEAYWWDQTDSQYRVRLQILTSEGEAFLLCKEQGRWSVIGRYV